MSNTIESTSLPYSVANEILSTVSHIMVPNPTKTIVGGAQSRLTDIIHELQRNLTRLMVVMKDEEYGGPVGRWGGVVVVGVASSRVGLTDITDLACSLATKLEECKLVPYHTTPPNWTETFVLLEGDPPNNWS